MGILKLSKCKYLKTELKSDAWPDALSYISSLHFYTQEV